MVQGWAVVVLVAFACGHSPAESPAPLPPNQTLPPRADPAPRTTVFTAPQTRSSVPQMSADEKQQRPVEAVVMPNLSKVNDTAGFTIVLRGEVAVEAHWTGYFIKDGRELPNTDFIVEQVKGHRGLGVIALDQLLDPDKLPSGKVRMFAPGVVH